MKSSEKGAARVTRGLRLLWGRLGAWRWGRVLGKLSIGAAGLVLLAVIGKRSALAGGGEVEPLVVAVAAAPANPTSTPTTQTTTPTATTTTTTTTTMAPTQATAPTEASANGPATSTPHARATPDDPVILNQATETDLRRLPGIGPKRAQAILALRAHLGRFRQVEDLLKVKGIGRATLTKLRPIVRLEALPPMTADAGAPGA
jgi:competence protein ComEA